MTQVILKQMSNVNLNVDYLMGALIINPGIGLLNLSMEDLNLETISLTQPNNYMVLSLIILCPISLVWRC